MTAGEGLGPEPPVLAAAKVRPCPENLWISRVVPPAAVDLPMVDLATGGVLLPGSVRPPQTRLPADDTVLLVDGVGAAGGPAARDHAVRLAGLGLPCLLQVAVPDLRRLLEAPAPAPPSRLVVDPLSRWAGSPGAEADALRELDPAGWSVLVPILPGLDGERHVEPLVDAWVRLGARTLVPVVVTAPPERLRLLADALAMPGGTSLRMFQAAGADPGPARRLVESAGGHWWMERPRCGDASRTAASRHQAGQLALVAMRGEHAGRSTGFVEGHRQAARRVEEERLDLSALAREGNLHVLDWLDPRVEETVRRWRAVDEALAGTVPADVLSGPD